MLTSLLSGNGVDRADLGANAATDTVYGNIRFSAFVVKTQCRATGRETFFTTDALVPVDDEGRHI